MKPALVRILRFLLPLIIVAGAGLVALTMIWSRPPVEILTPVVAPPGVRVHEVTLADAPLTVTSQGTVQPRTESQLVPEIAGRVTWVAPSFAEGGFFEAGDVLVRIDPFDYEQMLVSARSQLAQARLRLAEEEAEAEVAEREWETLGRGDPRELALRKPQLDDAHASVAAAEAGVERATRDLERADIRAPYAGRVRAKNVDIGQYVRVGDTVATVYAVDVAEIRLPLPDDELAYLDLPLSYRGVERQTQPGVTLHARFAGETHAWKGRIVRTESEIDSVSRMVHAIAEVADPYAPGPNPNRPPLAVGMYVEAEIGGRTARDVAVLPRETLRGRDQMLVVTPDDRLSFRTVDVLRTSTESVVVQSGLQAGELVVISPLDTPADGMLVQLTDADPGLLARRNGAAAAAPPPASGAATPAGEIPAVADAAPDTGVPGSAAPLTATDPDLPADAVAAVAGAGPDSDVSDTAAPPPATDLPDLPADAVAAVADRGPDSDVSERGATATTLPVAEAAAAAERAESQTTRAEPETADAAIDVAPESGAADRPAWLEAILRQSGPARDDARVTRAEPEAVADATARRAAGDAAVEAPAPVAAAAPRTARREALAPAATEPGPEVASAAPTETEPGPEVASAAPTETAATAGDAGTETAAGRPPGELRNALSVLPFDDLSSGGKTALDVDLGVVITEAVTERLAMLPAVGVVTDRDGAVWVVGGGIQRIGPLIRVTARLINVRSGAVISAVKVDGTVDALADLQERVADAMVESVRDALASEAGRAAGGAADAADPHQEGRQA